MDREGAVDGVEVLLRGTHLFLALRGSGSLPQPPEPAPQWGPAFLCLNICFLLRCTFAELSPACSCVVGR